MEMGNAEEGRDRSYESKPLVYTARRVPQQSAGTMVVDIKNLFIWSRQLARTTLTDQTTTVEVSV